MLANYAAYIDNPVIKLFHEVDLPFEIFGSIFKTVVGEGDSAVDMFITAETQTDLGFATRKIYALAAIFGGAPNLEHAQHLLEQNSELVATKWGVVARNDGTHLAFIYATVPAEANVWENMMSVSEAALMMRSQLYDPTQLMVLKMLDQAGMKRQMPHLTCIDTEATDNRHLELVIKNAGLRYEVDPDMNRILVQVDFPNGRSQMCYLYLSPLSAASFGDEKLIFLCSPGISADEVGDGEELSLEVMNTLLSESGELENGGWQIQPNGGAALALFGMWIVSKPEEGVLMNALNHVAQTADRLEERLTGEDSW